MAEEDALWHYQHMINAYFWISGIVLLAVSIGGVMAYFGIRTAPDGYEDSEGFHVVSAREQEAPVVAAGHSHHEAVSLAA